MEDSGIDSDPRNPIAKEENFKIQENYSDSSSSSSNTVEFSSRTPKNTRQLHRKLEQRIQEAKKLQKVNSWNRKSQTLVHPSFQFKGSQFQVNLQQLLAGEHLPLVDWDTEDSDEDIHFFPIKPPVRQELTDTFSIEEYQISPDEDDLNLLPPQPVYQRFSFCCCSVSPKCSIL